MDRTARLVNTMVETLREQEKGSLPRPAGWLTLSELQALNATIDLEDGFAETPEGDIYFKNSTFWAKQIAISRRNRARK